MTTVAVYGSVNWDEICRLPRYPAEHEKLDALAIDSALGGSAANTATWLATLVDRVELIGAVGDDPEGQLCLDWLDAAGVGRAGVETIAGARSSRACSWVVGSDKREQAPTAALELLSGVDHLHLGSTIDAAGIDCLSAAVNAGLSVSIELSGKTHDEVRPHADLVFLNSEELRANFGLTADALGPEAVATVAPRAGAALVITHGTEPIVCATTDGVQRFPVAALEQVVDRTGGGDAFDAGFIAGWLSGHDPRRAVELGLEASRAVLQQVGGARRPTASA